MVVFDVEHTTAVCCGVIVVGPELRSWYNTSATTIAAIATTTRISLRLYVYTEVSLDVL
jgi:hypothetical protein